MSTAPKLDVVHQEDVPDDKDVKLNKARSSAEEISTVNDDGVLEKSTPRIDKVDYSGAYEKTDPREIALVKKLDRWIMVSSNTAPQDVRRILMAICF